MQSAPCATIRASAHAIAFCRKNSNWAGDLFGVRIHEFDASVKRKLSEGELGVALALAPVTEGMERGVLVSANRG